MAFYGKNIEGYTASRIVKFVSTETIENYTVYVIEVSIGPNKWRVKHRYSEFYELHEKLIALYKLEKTLLPPKKLFGNQSEAFIKKRQTELEVYLQTVISHLTSIPVVLMTFLDFHRYEVHGITQSLAAELFQKGDSILQAGETFHITPLQLNAISTRLKLPEPTCESGDKTKDLGHVLDFVTRLRFLKIQGCKSKIGTSNMEMNELSYDMSMFKSLEALQLNICAPDKMSGIESLKKSLKTMCVHKSVKALKDVLMLDIGQGQWHGGESESLLVAAWGVLTSVDFSHNDISNIDESVKFIPKVESLDLSNNRLQDIQHLQNLTELVTLDLSYNVIRNLNSLHTKLGNIKSLTILGNKLETLQGFSKLYSLEYLNVCNNEISQVLEVKHISGLPCLENLNLTGNPVTIVLDYRTKMLELFGERAKEVCLDKEKPSQKELDTVAVRLAIQKSKEAKDKTKKHKKPATEVHIADANSDDASSSASALTTTSQNLPTLTTTTTTTTTTSSTSTLLQQCQSAFNASLPHNTSSSDLYRLQVEAIREQGGSAWLSLLNQMQREREERELLHERKMYQQIPNVEEAIDVQLGQNISTVPARDGSTQCAFMLPETLPGKADSTFMSVIQAMTPDRRALSHMAGIGDENQHWEERPLHIMWVTYICYTSPCREVPACVYITNENLHIFKVNSLKSDYGDDMDLEHAYCIPLLNIQQIVLGYEELYLRIEEAFVGPQGTFTFLTHIKGKTDMFLEALKMAMRRAQPDVESCDEPHVAVNGATELCLKETLNKRENFPHAGSVSIVLYMLVHAPVSHSSAGIHGTHALVLTTKYLYLLQEDYILWPQPTFAIGPSSRPQFQIVSSYPIGGRICGIQMYDSDSYSKSNFGLPQSYGATEKSDSSKANFVGFGVKLTFENSHDGNRELNVRVPTSGMRDRLLAKLTQVRKEMTERSPSPPKMKSRHRVRDGETSSTDSGETNGHSKLHSKSKKGRKKAPREVTFDPTDTLMSNLSLRPEAEGSADDPVPAKPVVPQNPFEEQTNNSEESLNPFYDPANPDDDDDVKKADSKNPFDGLSDNPFEQEEELQTQNDTFETDPYLSHNPHLHASPDSHSQSSSTYLTPNYEGSPQTSSNVLQSAALHHSLANAALYQPMMASAIVTPVASGSMYPTVDLLGHLTECNDNVQILIPLSPLMKNLSHMTGEEVLNFFHNNIVQIGNEQEELNHIMWSAVTPYTTPRQEITTCVMLSNKALYFVSEDCPSKSLGRLARKTHSRNKSDTMFTKSKSYQGIHHSSGVIHTSSSEQYKMQQIIKSYCTIPLEELCQVDVGMFDQMLRVAGKDESSVYSCITRCNLLTEDFIKQLMSALSNQSKPPQEDLLNSGSEQDFYKTFGKARAETLEFIHASQVKFVYPSEEAVAELTYVVINHIKGKKPAHNLVNVLLYSLVFQLEIQRSSVKETKSEFHKGRPRTLILTNSHVVLAQEDYVSYPLPEFAKGVPAHPQTEITEIRNLELLTRVVMCSEETHDLTLVFSDENEEIEVDVSVNHFTRSDSYCPTDTPQEISITIALQNLKDKQRALKHLQRQWNEINEGKELEVIITKL